MLVSDDFGNLCGLDDQTSAFRITGRYALWVLVQVHYAEGTLRSFLALSQRTGGRGLARSPIRSLSILAKPWRRYPDRDLEKLTAHGLFLHLRLAFLKSIDATAESSMRLILRHPVVDRQILAG